MKDDNQTPNNETVNKLFRKLQAGIENTPIPELTKHVGDAFNLNSNRETVPVHEAIAELGLLASLGYEKSLRDLVYIGSCIAKKLRELPCSENAEDSPVVTSDESDDDGMNSLKNILRELEQLPDRHRTKVHDVVAQHTPPSNVTYLETDDELVEDICNRLIQKKINTAVSRNVATLASNSQTWPVLYPAIRSHKANWVDNYIESIGLGSQLGIYLHHKTGYKKNHDSSSFNWYDLAIHLFVNLNAVRTNSMAASHVEEWRKAEDDNEGVTQVPGSKIVEYAIPSPPGLSQEWNVNNVWQRKAKFLPELSSDDIDLWLEASMARIASECGGEFLDYPWPEDIVNRANKHGERIETTVREKLKIQFTKIASAR